MRLQPSEPLRFQPGPHPALAANDASERDLWREWDVLADRMAAPPFLRPAWFVAWQRAYGDGDLRVLSVREGDRLAGVLPIEVRGRATLSPTNTHTPLFGPIAESPEVERALATELLHQCGGRIELCYLDPGTTFADSLRGSDRVVRVDTVLRSPHLSLAEDAPKPPRKLLKELRRQRRRLEEQGLVDVTVHETVRGIESAIEEFVHVEASGWKAEQGTAIASRDASARFYEEIARWAAQLGWLRLYFLRLEGRPIAAEFDIECAGALYALKSGFDPEFRAFGPGQLLTGECIAAATEAGLSTYEFLGTDEPYKLMWTSATRERVRMQAFPPTVAGRAQALSRTRVRPLARRLLRR